MKIKQKVLDKYAWYLFNTRQDEPRPLPEQMLPFNEKGLTAVECFHVFESTGKITACKENLLLERYIKGKEWHGVTVETVTKSLSEGLVCDFELNEYPLWVKEEIIKQAKKLSLQSIGFVPMFVQFGVPSKYSPHFRVS